ncbi:hypothetical protein M422DRAFT_243709 [Sphaerobolus stellatus SS14]|nr:hypothetical protein M422DRAFT_243709 [Sphaerobolus stellatus SS14]
MAPANLFHSSRTRRAALFPVTLQIEAFVSSEAWVVIFDFERGEVDVEGVGYFGYESTFDRRERCRSCTGSSCVNDGAEKGRDRRRDGGGCREEGDGWQPRCVMSQEATMALEISLDRSCIVATDEGLEQRQRSDPSLPRDEAAWWRPMLAAGIQRSRIPQRLSTILGTDWLAAPQFVVPIHAFDVVDDALLLHAL